MTYFAQIDTSTGHIIIDDKEVFESEPQQTSSRPQGLLTNGEIDTARNLFKNFSLSES
jgi:hypothetical protein